MKGFTTNRDPVQGMTLGRTLDPLDAQDGGPVFTAVGYYLDEPSKVANGTVPTDARRVADARVREQAEAAAVILGARKGTTAPVAGTRQTLPPRRSDVVAGVAPVASPTTSTGLPPRRSDVVGVKPPGIGTARPGAGLGMTGGEPAVPRDVWTGVVVDGPGSPVSPGGGTPTDAVAEAPEAAKTSPLLVVVGLAVVGYFLLKG